MSKYQRSKKDPYARPDQDLYQSPKQDLFQSPKITQDKAPEQDEPRRPTKDEKNAALLINMNLEDDGSCEHIGQITLRMNKKAKQRLVNASAKKRKGQFMLFKEALCKAREHGFQFSEKELDTRDYSESLNIGLSAAQYNEIKAAKDNLNTSIYALVSAIILREVPKR